MAEAVTFYKLPPARFAEVRQAARSSWRERRALEALDAVLATLRQPRAPFTQTPECYLSAARGVIGDTPLPSGEGMLGEDSERYEEFLVDLNEGVGGMWDIIEPSPERIAALDPETFDVERLHAHYRGALSYYEDPDDDDDDEDDQPDGLIDTVLFAVIEKLGSDDPADFPAEAGEEIRRGIGVLREALAAVGDDCVLLIRN
jgi:hypothetical protein